MRVVIDAGWGPPPVIRDGIATRHYRYCLPEGELTVTLQRSGEWVAGQPFRYQDAYLIPGQGQQGCCWYDRVAIEVIVAAERAPDEAQPPQIER